MRALRALRRRVTTPPIVRLERAEPGRVFDNQLLLGRNVLVTGAGRNIGRSIAFEMARQGANVYFTDLEPAAASRLQSDLEANGTRARGFVSDVSNPADVEALCAILAADGIVVDVLANNVGVTRGGGLRTLTMADLRAVFESNVFGPLQLTQSVVNGLIAAGTSGGGPVRHLGPRVDHVRRRGLQRQQGRPGNGRQRARARARSAPHSSQRHCPRGCVRQRAGRASPVRRLGAVRVVYSSELHRTRGGLSRLGLLFAIYNRECADRGCWSPHSPAGPMTSDHGYGRGPSSPRHTRPSARRPLRTSRLTRPAAPIIGNARR